MFPINLRYRRLESSYCRLYIPLCFLLIRIFSGQVFYRNLPLHSTMFPINLIQRRNFPKSISLYIPLCFLLIRSGRTFLGNAVLLYIPLCFLLIWKRAENSLTGLCSLHSTMFPINQAIQIYNHYRKHLYIPLCFLLIYSRTLLVWQVRVSFTFHYVSY